VTLARWPRERGHDVEEVGVWPQDPGDAAILQHAADTDRVLVTIDADFGLPTLRGRDHIEAWSGFRIARRAGASASSPTCSYGTKQRSPRVR
jgi:hypothetical protein